MKRVLALLLFCALAAGATASAPLRHAAVIQAKRSAGASSLLTGLVAYWKLDESSDGSVQVDRADSSGAGITLTDGNTTASGTLGGDAAADFEASNSETLTAASDLAALDFNGNQSFTIAFWFRFESSAADQYLLSKWQTPDFQYGVTFQNTTDRLRFLVSADGTSSTAVLADSLGAVSNAVDYFVVCWHDADADTINIQVNDGTVDSAAHSTGIFNGSTIFRLGNRPTANHADGLMKKIGVWSRVLTTGERTTLAGNATYPF